MDKKESWLRCSEQLPEKNGWYEVTLEHYYGKREIAVCYFESCCNLWSLYDQMPYKLPFGLSINLKAIAWRKLDAPYDGPM